MTILYAKNETARGLSNISCALESHVRYFKETKLVFDSMDFSRLNGNVGLVVRDSILDAMLVSIDELKSEIKKLQKEIR